MNPFKSRPVDYYVEVHVLARRRSRENACLSHRVWNRRYHLVLFHSLKDQLARKLPDYTDQVETRLEIHELNTRNGDEHILFGERNNSYFIEFISQGRNFTLMTTNITNLKV